MRKLMIALLVYLFLPCIVMAQKPPVVPRAPEAPQAPAPPRPPSPPPELGKWWKNSEVVRKLEISETQVKQLEQIFLDHRLKLVDLRAELERREIQLKPLLDVDRPDEAKVMAQTERIAAARGELEKANTTMMLAMRRTLSTGQWKELQEIRKMRSLPPSPPPPAPPAPPAMPAPPAPPRAPADSEEHVYSYETDPSIVRPFVVYQTKPAYTPEAKAAKIDGVVLVQAIVRKDGSLGKVKVIRGLGYGLDEAAIASMKDWRFKPGTLNGKPVNVRANIEIAFRLY